MCSLSKISGHCDRCNKPTNKLNGSYFNTDMCCEECITKERQHPDYERAVRVENLAVRHGNMNFKGIGLPSDLMVSESEKQANLAMAV